MSRKLLALLLPLLALPPAVQAQTAAQTVNQQILRNAMVVVVKFYSTKEPWEYAENMASASGMQLIGVSPSTRSAVYRVTRETNMSTAPVASRNQQLLISQFPGVIEAYNYGLGLATPVDLQATNPNPPRRETYNYDDRRGNDRGRGNAYGRRPSYRLTERDRVTVQDWYDRGRNMNSRVRIGYPLPPDLTSVSYPAPPELTRQLSAMPADYRYFVVGGSLVLLDGRNTVVDLIRFDPNR